MAPTDIPKKNGRNESRSMKRAGDTRNFERLLVEQSRKIYSSKNTPDTVTFILYKILAYFVALSHTLSNIKAPIKTSNKAKIILLTVTPAVFLGSSRKLSYFV